MKAKNKSATEKARGNALEFIGFLFFLLALVFGVCLFLAYFYLHIEAFGQSLPLFALLVVADLIGIYLAAFFFALADTKNLED